MATVRWDRSGGCREGSDAQGHEPHTNRGRGLGRRIGSSCAAVATRRSSLFGRVHDVRGHVTLTPAMRRPGKLANKRRGALGVYFSNNDKRTSSEPRSHHVCADEAEPPFEPPVMVGIAACTGGVLVQLRRAIPSGD